MIDISTGNEMTRREFGKGLSAIIAAGVAPSIALGALPRGLGMRSGMMISGDGLPYDCEIEYLEGTGTQYIDTLIRPNKNFTFNTKVASTQNSFNTVYWGTRSSGDAGSNGLQCFLNGNTSGTSSNKQISLFTTNINMYGDNWYSGIVPQVNVMYELEGMTCYSQMRDMVYPVQLFGFISAGSRVLSLGKCRIGLWQAFDNYDLVADFIPVRVGSGDSAVGYMYDRVSKRLFGNAGTGNFIIGPDKN